MKVGVAIVGLFILVLGAIGFIIWKDFKPDLSRPLSPGVYKVRLEGHDYYRAGTGNFLVHSEACPCHNPTNR